MLLIAIAIAFLISIVFLYISFARNQGDEISEIIEITPQNGWGKLYIKKKAWGTRFDQQVIVISDSDSQADISAADPESGYVYEGMMPFLYKMQNDTLFIYTLKTVAVPRNFKTDLRIDQVRLEKSGMKKMMSELPAREKTTGSL